MLSKKSFYSDGRNAYIIKKMTDKTVLFVPVKSKYIGSDVSSAYLFDSLHRATMEPDESKQPVRFKLSNNVSTRDLAVFYETKKGTIETMYELKDDTFAISHNYG